MSTASVERAGASAEIIERPPYRLTAVEFFRAVDADVFAPGHTVGLWDGWIYEKMARKIPHSVSYNKLLFAVVSACPAGWCVWSDSPILLDDFSVPLPDLAIVRGRLVDYSRRKSVPKFGEIGLVVEVSDSTLRKDLAEGLRSYAGAGLPYYWVVNLVARKVEVFGQPITVEGVSRYATAEAFGPGQDVPIVLDGAEVARIQVRDLLPGEGD